MKSWGEGLGVWGWGQGLRLGLGLGLRCEIRVSLLDNLPGIVALFEISVQELERRA